MTIIVVVVVIMIMFVILITIICDYHGHADDNGDDYGWYNDIDDNNNIMFATCIMT